MKTTLEASEYENYTRNEWTILVLAKQLEGYSNAMGPLEKKIQDQIDATDNLIEGLGESTLETSENKTTPETSEDKTTLETSEG